mmetsp:Transcript_42601/g.89401  ORF Transcript_42601/g.89401 Transcript_42601/m.89401 type:complete len:539 (-) Transcript_42601:100-1716(-)|eukprot:CAMPEP_0183729084 /NCGR_PEP_ID=MMETSP0737-20130205/29673_1 /TAXON_ID=385413 /ORGANISM="Thalassiosira miniscula, Strain CCMP1093" /LENGTH=538 /DNA_ID=CAMNT_0025961189 /DNA_START=161 /DNA_END=1777 /DNA_ORIENTATION=-
MSPNSEKVNSNSGGALLPFLALLVSQILFSSWHVLGKHVMAQVPYLAPISYVLIRTLISSLFLLSVGIVHEGRVQFPPLFLKEQSTFELSLSVGLMKPSSPNAGSSSQIESGNSLGLGLSLSQPPSGNSSNAVFSGTSKKKVEDPQPSLHKRHHHHRPRRKKGGRWTFKKYVITAIRSVKPSLWNILRNMLFTFKLYQQQLNNLNPDAIQIIFAGLAGMLLLPICYTTGLILTSPTVASVWDGPMIPLGCFCAAVSLGLEKKSKSHPFGQVGSLLLAVGGSIVVLLVDYLGGGHGIEANDDAKGGKSGNGAVDSHVQFIQGNMVLMGVVAAYSATALLQKSLSRYPPIQLTGWMFGIGHLGCLALLLLDSVLGSRITGCTLGQAIAQIYIALTTSPTFRFGLVYSAFFVGGICFSSASYASAHLESSVVTLFAATQPPITAVLEWIWEGKGLGWKKLLGMACVGIGMWLFTKIKRLEKDEKINDGDHNQKNKRIQSNSHTKLPQLYENGDIVIRSNGNRTPNRDRSPNLTNRKTHADV